ncbi:unnamed protein product, partial [marine sediment metagenome]
CHGNDRLKEGDMLIDSAKRISESFDPVNIIKSLIEYHRLSVKLYKKNLRVK